MRFETRAGPLNHASAEDWSIILSIQKRKFDLIWQSKKTLNNTVIAGWLARSLAPFVDDGVNDGFLFDFSTPIKFFSIEAGDFAPSDYDVITLTGFDGLNGSGTIVGQTTLDYGFSGFPTVASISTSASSMLSVIATGGSASYPNSLFWDNIRAEPVPGPLPIFGAVTAFGYSRKLRKRIACGRRLPVSNTTLQDDGGMD